MKRIVLVIMIVVTGYVSSEVGGARGSLTELRLADGSLKEPPAEFRSPARGNHAGDMGRQAQELEQILARHREIGEAAVQKSGEVITVMVSSRAAFSAGSDQIKPSCKDVLDRLSEILTVYPGTSLTIVGHTDSQGASDYNQLISERRAKALSDYLRSRGVNPTRLRSIGKGATDPVATNATATGRAANARLEILVEPLSKSAGTLKAD